MALSLRRMFSRPANIILHHVFFGKGMALSLRADVFPSGKYHSASCIFGKGMALSLRADVFPSGKYHSASCIFGKGMALSLLRMFSRPANIILHHVFSERAWPYPYGRMFSHSDGITSETIYDKKTTGRAV